MKLKILVNITRKYLPAKFLLPSFLKFIHFSNFFPPNLNNLHSRQEMLESSNVEKRKKGKRILKNSSRRKRNAHESIPFLKRKIYVYFEVSAQPLSGGYVHRKCCSSFVKEMSRYHGAGKSIIRRKDEATGSSAVFRRNLLLKRGQRGIRRGERTLRDDATGIRRAEGGDVGAMRKYDVFLSFNFADKDPAGLSFTEVKTSKGRSTTVLLPGTLSSSFASSS